MPSSNRKNVYKALGVAGSSAALLGIVLIFSPISVGAFWPISSANAADGDSPILHDPSIRLLAAATNSDPNPDKGGDFLSLSDDSALISTRGPDGTLPATGGTNANDDSPEAHSGSGSISVYVVKNGDSISGIADHFGVSVNTILWANDLTIKSTIKPGMSLVILPVSGVKHVVQKGETLSSIAAASKASASEIATFNGLDTDATVVVGSALIIPGGEVTNTAAKAPTKAATTKTTTKTSTKVSVKTGKDLGTAVATSGYFTNPVPGAILYQGIHGNNAVDLSAPAGTPIHAAAAGTVIVSKGDGGWNGGYGSYVVISHANGTQTLYAHMSKDIVSVGDTVSQGELIGYVGETGEATGNHLHFEVRGAKNPFGYTCTIMSRCY